MNRDLTVAEAMADAFSSEGVNTVFALMGDGNMYFLPHLVRRNVQVYNVRHESMAVAMADGYYRSTGRIGICSVTCGPGLTQIATCLMIARRHGAAMVVMAGDSVRTGAYGGLQEMDQRRFIEASGGIFQPVRLPETLAEDVRKAFFRARTIPGPVVLNVPIDVQQTVISSAWDYSPSQSLFSQHAAPIAAMEDIESAAEMLVQSNRPVFLLGRGALQAEAVAEVERVADMVGALLATTLPAKGAFAGHPFDLGVAGGYGSLQGLELLRDADLVIAVGASLSYYTTGNDSLFPIARIVHINRDPNALVAERRAPDRLLLGDASATIHVLAELVCSGRNSGGTRYRTTEVASLLSRDLRLLELQQEAREISDGTVDPRELMLEIDDALPDGSLIVSCGAHSGSFVGRFLSGKRSRQFIHSSEFGSIGQAMSTGIGAALARQNKFVVVFEGDGAAMMNIQELDTVSRYGARMLIVILNDQGFGTEMHRLTADPEAFALAQVPTPDFAALARAFGLDACTVRQRGEALNGVQRAVSGSRPFLMDVRIAREVVNNRMFAPPGGQQQRQERRRRRGRKPGRAVDAH